MNTDFDWPTPPHFELISKPANNSVEPAFIVMNDSQKLTGRMLRLIPAASLVEFHPDRAVTNLSIGFSSFKSLHLAQPIELKRLPLSNIQGSIEVYPSSEKQRCVVRFKDGSELVAEVTGFVFLPFGVFLFVTSHSNKVLRWFIPGDAMASCETGDLLGKILVDQKIVSHEQIEAGLKQQEQLRSQKLGDYLTREDILTQQQLEAALKSQKSAPQLRLGEALLLEQLVTKKQLNDALQLQSQDRKLRLGEILIRMGLLTGDTLARVLVQKLGVPYVNLQTFKVDPTVIETIPLRLAKKHTVLPLYKTDSRIIVAMENPLAWDALEEIGFYTKLKVDPVLASPSDLALMIERFYSFTQGREEDLSDLVSELEAGDERGKPPAEEEVTESHSALVRLVNRIIVDAYRQGVSDIHIESFPGNTPSKVRFRKDGVMMPYSDIPANFRAALISRIKIMSRLDISEKRHSQDGKVNFEQFGPAKIELRIVTVPTANGLEDIVMRILAAPKALSLDSIGLGPHVLAELKRLAVKPHGLFFVCGPTGSGKTTTLHSMLSHINTPERKIWTAEDPIEITQKGLRQVQVNAKIDWTFANVLRTFLRADPDVIMVGETRDPETAKIVIEASLTGHLVFSTMHTNSAAESVVRLLDLGLDPFNFADALIAVLSQRLTRRLCAACRKPHVASLEQMALLAQEYCRETQLVPEEVLLQWRAQYGHHDELVLFTANGCKECDQMGYKGRLGIHELLVVSPAMKRKIYAKANVAELSHVAAEEGMRTLRQDGIDKILQGHTDLEQIQAVCI
ncbi:MAG TPA: ATPase, T2SS/T4P/T4SS family [Burkholderiales bacterium]|nr:ATPase, T2SS/T4P/T4SS family [Burkholderiales bacterium]